MAMMIALDIDGTYTLHPEFWDAFIEFARLNGHSVIVATMRYDHGTEAQEVKDALENKVEKIIFTNRKQKRQVVAEAGYYPSVWIDDMPEAI